MRCLAKAAVFLLGPAVVNALAAPPPSNVAADDSATDAGSQAAPVLLWRNDRNAIVRFGALYQGSVAAGNNGLLLEFNAGLASEPCEEENVFLNGQELLHTWDGNAGHGSGTINTLPFDNAISAPLSANWESLCIPPQTDSPDNRTVQLLTVKINSIGEEHVEDETVGFTASFVQTDVPEILRLETHSLNISSNDMALDAWRDPFESQRLENQPNVIEVGDDKLEKQIEREMKKLQDLKTQAVEIKKQIAEEEERIRQLLRQDCRPLMSKWKQCRSIGCMIKVSLQTVPEMIQQLRYQFAPLPTSMSGKLAPICSQDGGPDPLPTRPDQGLPIQGNQTNATTDYVPNDGTRTPVIPSPNMPFPDASDPEKPSPGSDLSLHDKIRAFARSCSIILLVATLSTLVFRLCRDSMTCRRRRADLAARREERRARRAYRAAARRYRWRQWWEGRTGQCRPTAASEELDPAEDAEQGQAINLISHREPEEGAMQAEILGLRRVFEFVGELIRNDDDQDQNRRPRRQSRYEIEELPRSGSLSRNSAPSSTAGLTTTMNSPRTSSLMSLDTVSSVTLETLDTLESEPPGYYG
ncbi:hypothetical protein Plec18167_002693 [Paecilomyces lecythidis]|uniref:Uncharacterized protein n=1 Tax=Paecilomyces lecythidis TaxID=3004212 RepID=A0ABR3Y5X2_9EURO